MLFFCAVFFNYGVVLLYSESSHNFNYSNKRRVAKTDSKKDKNQFL